MERVKNVGTEKYLESGELMTYRECAIVEAYTGICMLTEENAKYRYQYAEEKFGCPVYTHFFLSEFFNMQLKQKAKKDFLELCRNATEGGE